MLYVLQVVLKGLWFALADAFDILRGNKQWIVLAFRCLLLLVLFELLQGYQILDLPIGVLCASV